MPTLPVLGAQGCLKPCARGKSHQQQHGAADEFHLCWGQQRVLILSRYHGIVACLVATGSYGFSGQPLSILLNDFWAAEWSYELRFHLAKFQNYELTHHTPLFEHVEKLGAKKR